MKARTDHDPGAGAWQDVPCAAVRDPADGRVHGHESVATVTAVGDVVAVSPDGVFRFAATGSAFQVRAPG